MLVSFLPLACGAQGNFNTEVASFLSDISATRLSPLPNVVDLGGVTDHRDRGI